MGLDRINYANTGVADLEKLTPEARQFLDELELASGVPIEFVGTGFGTFDAIHILPKSLRSELSHV
jgi:adenylosuccinate synthase